MNRADHVKDLAHQYGYLFEKEGQGALWAAVRPWLGGAAWTGLAGAGTAADVQFEEQRRRDLAALLERLKTESWKRYFGSKAPLLGATALLGGALALSRGGAYPLSRGLVGALLGAGVGAAGLAAYGAYKKAPAVKQANLRRWLEQTEQKIKTEGLKSVDLPLGLHKLQYTGE